MGNALAVHLLGRPVVRSPSADPGTPRGRKVWALLAYLLTTDAAPGRQWLADLLFADAQDPLNALSWNLGQLRRLLGPDGAVGGEPVTVRLPPGAFVDVHALTAGTWVQALEVPGLGRDLLEGMSFPSSPAFEVWLLTERRRLAAAAHNVLREAALAELAGGDPRKAVELAGRLVASNPLDEDAQELLIRAYAATGDAGAAKRQWDACVTLFRRELGLEPGDAVRRAAVVPHPRPAPVRPATAASIAAQLEAGLAALDAGASDVAIPGLRQAVTAAHQAGAGGLEARALLALGSALVHAVRGRDGEGAGLLHQAIGVAEKAAEPQVAARARRELGYVEGLRGRYDRAERWVREAGLLAAGDAEEQAWIAAVHGVVLTDTGRSAAAIDALHEAVRCARESGVDQAETWALTFLGRAHLLRRELGPARQALEAALEGTRRLRWTSFLPLPEALLADVDLAEGRIDAAEAAYEHAHALALQFGDPCWEGFAGRGLGLVAARRGDVDTALHLVTEARTRCIRLPDAWLWVEGFCLEALCRLAIDLGRPDARRSIADLEALATRTGMREFAAHAYLYRARLGDRTAVDAARVLAAEVDNPAVLVES
jgi:DNA-binding SARP family transcriptional activator